MAMNPYIGAPPMDQWQQAQGGGGMAPVIAAAGIQAGGSFLSQYLAARQAEADAKRKEELERKRMLMEIAQNQGTQEQSALSNLMNAYRSTLIGG